MDAVFVQMKQLPFKDILLRDFSVVLDMVFKEEWDSFQHFEVLMAKIG